MKLFLLVFFAATCNAVSFGKSSNHEWKRNIIAESQQQIPNNLPPPGPYCQSLVAYVVGTFQARNSATPSFSAEFQVRLNADLKTKQITVYADQWNEEFADSDDFELDFYYGSSYQWCSIKENDCSSLFAKNITSFYLDINKQDVSFFHVLYFDYFNNSFALNQASGTCTKHQLDGINDDKTPDLRDLSICVCCDYYDPATILGCPADPWKDATSAPAATTVIQTTPPPVTTATPPKPSYVKCDAVTAFYSGTFRNNAHRDQMDVKFQLKMSADEVNQKFYFDIDQWGEAKTKSSNIVLNLVLENERFNPCKPPTNNNCSASYYDYDDVYFLMDLYRAGHWDNQFIFSYFPRFRGKFPLYSAVGGCTKFQQPYDSALAANTTFFDFCICCGDTYSPDASLGCPENT